MDRRQFVIGTAAVAGGALARTGDRARRDRDLVLLSGRGRRADHQDHRRLCGRLREGEPGIKVKPIYAGTYQETIVKALTAHKAGNPPVTSVLLSTDMFTLIDEEAIVPFDDFTKGDADKQWIKSFFPAFMENSQTGGKTWGVPFQRSTVVLYWNKEPFKEAGLDPEKAPATWAEELAFAEKLTKRDGSGNATQWGMQIPSSGFPYWLFQGLTTQNDVVLMNQEGNRTFYDKPEVIEALAALGRPRPQAQGDAAGHRRMGHHAEGLLRAQDAP